MIETILSSKTNIRIIKFLSFQPNKYFTIKEIENWAYVKGGNLRRALRKLEAFDIIIADPDMNKLRYKIKTTNHIYQSLKILFEVESERFQGIQQKEINIMADFVNELYKKYDDIYDIILFGSVARGLYSNRSDIDILILKDEKSTNIEMEIIKIKEKFERKIQFFIHTPEEYKTLNEPLFKEIKNEGISLIKLFNINTSKNLNTFVSSDEHINAHIDDD